MIPQISFSEILRCSQVIRKSWIKIFYWFRRYFPFLISCCKRANIETRYSLFLWRYRCKWKYHNTAIGESNSDSLRTNAISARVKLLWFYKKFNLRDFKILLLLWLYMLMLVLKVLSKLTAEYKCTLTATRRNIKTVWKQKSGLEKLPDDEI